MPFVKLVGCHFHSRLKCIHYAKARKTATTESAAYLRVTVSLRVSNVTPTIVTHYPPVNPESVGGDLHAQPITSIAIANKMELLECPMCDFTIPRKDHGDYVLQLHFEQVHTTDSPFVIEDDLGPLPPSVPLSPSSKRKHAVDTPSDDSDEDEGTVVCSEPDCGEVVSLSDFNDHLDYHTAETLSFDEVRSVREALQSSSSA